MRLDHTESRFVLCFNTSHSKSVLKMKNRYFSLFSQILKCLGLKSGTEIVERPIIFKQFLFFTIVRSVLKTLKSRCVKPEDRSGNTFCMICTFAFLLSEVQRAWTVLSAPKPLRKIINCSGLIFIRTIRLWCLPKSLPFISLLICTSFVWNVFSLAEIKRSSHALYNIL